jgi:pantoate--beta-alanine ligase
LDSFQEAGERIALVPTMGALHAGHLALVRAAKRRADRVVVSLFVNPAQFAPHEDFGRYPRTLKADLAALAREEVDLVWAPSVDEMYPDGFATRLSP